MKKLVFDQTQLLYLWVTPVAKETLHRSFPALTADALAIFGYIQHALQ